MVGGLSILFFVEWRSSHDEGNRQSELIRRVVRELEQRIDISASQSRTLLGVVRKGQDALLLELRKGRSETKPSVPGVEGPIGAPLVEVPPPEESSAVVEIDPELPPVPGDIDPREIIQQGVDPNAILQDRRFNPKGKELTRIEKQQAFSVFTWARGKRDILESDIQTGVAEGMELLRTRGDYVEYAKDEPFIGVEGVLSAGEEIENGGVRLFYLYPEEFPKVYAAKQERDAVPETAVRKLLKILAG